MSEWSLVCHISAESGGVVAIVSGDGGRFRVQQLPVAEASGRGAERRPLFIGAGQDRLGAWVLDPEARKIVSHKALPSDAFPIYSYRDPDGQHVWFVSDGDEETGNDPLNCADQGSPVIVVRNSGQSAELSRIICAGRGHHVVTFTAPTRNHPDLLRRAFVSNLLDGSICVVGHDPQDSSSYLQVLDTINLAEPDKDEEGANGVPNNAFPHGQVYSDVTGLIYSLSNGYGSISVIDPRNNAIVNRMVMKKSSNLLLSPDGRYLIGKGADRKSNAEHVLGILSVADIRSNKVVHSIEVPDFYPSVYRFSPDGSRLYVTSAATGKGAQHKNLKKNVVRVYDATKLPALELLREVQVGVADCGRRPLAFLAPGGKPVYVFIPNPSDGTLTILDGRSDQVLETVSIGPGNAEEVNFSFWDGTTYGA
ncbi:MAG: YncE family protein [Gammaproteobacteria bacterium]|nr:YncE family protein [Gammaproteobacteria bacterium]